MCEEGGASEAAAAPGVRRACGGGGRAAAAAQRRREIWGRRRGAPAAGERHAPIRRARRGGPRARRGEAAHGARACSACLLLRARARCRRWLSRRASGRVWWRTAVGTTVCGRRRRRAAGEGSGARKARARCAENSLASRAPTRAHTHHASDCGR